MVLLNYSTQDSKHLIKTLKAIRDEGRDVIGVSASGIYTAATKLPSIGRAR